VTRYRCVDAQEAAGFAVARACEAMCIPASAYYAWRAQDRQGLTPRAERDARVLAAIRDIHHEHRDYGSRGRPPSWPVAVWRATTRRSRR